MTTTAPETLQTVPLAAVVAGKNPRKTMEPAALDALAASIKAQGILHPVLLRPHPKKAGKFQVVAGHRRVLASTMAGLEEIPAQVRAMTDAEVEEAATTENLQREDLDPIESADAIAAMLEHRTTTEVAARIGWAEKAVARRARLAALSGKWRKARGKHPEGVGSWGAELLEIVALLAPDHQDEILAEYTTSWNANRAAPQRSELVGQVEEMTRVLGNAPWALDDAELEPKAGACTSCAKHSGSQTALFDDQVDGDVSTARCQDPDCWIVKLATHRVSLLDAARAKNPDDDLVALQGDHVQAEYRQRRRNTPKGNKLTKALERVLPSMVLAWDWTRCKKSDAGAKRGFVVDGQGSGKLTWFKLNGTRSSASNAATKAKAGKKAAPKSDAVKLKEGRVRLRRRRQGAFVDVMRDKVSDLKGAELSAEVALQLVAAFGATRHALPGNSRAKRLALLVAGHQVAGKLIWPGVRVPIVENLRRFGGMTDADLKNLDGQAERLGILLFGGKVVDDLREQVEKEIPKPKSLAALERGGGKKKPAPKAKKAAKKKPARKKAAKKAPSRGGGRKAGARSGQRPAAAKKSSSRK